ncbi:MAG: hypothetical protein RML95_12795 [Anaerolineae bacterium]|nr:hypothetical protein [Anaerolineae bacterium]
MRFEGVFHSLTLLAMLVAIYLRYRSWRILIRHIWEIAPIVSLAWLLYFAWFFSGADAIGNVPAKLSFFEKLERMLEVLGSQLSVTDWIIVGIGVVLLWAKMARHFAWLSLLVAFISLYIMLAAPELSARYAFQALPYLVTLYSAILVRAFQEFPLRIIAAAALVMYISQALLSLTPLPLPLAYREHPEAIRLKQAADELALWRQTSGYQNATIYTLCIDLMIFAQFDIRMPFTTLNFSSQRFMPPDQALPRIAAQGGLFLSCPDFHSGLRADVTTAWQDFYRHLRHAESTNFGRCCVLERVGQVHGYTLYRVRLAASKL